MPEFDKFVALFSSLSFFDIVLIFSIGFVSIVAICVVLYGLFILFTMFIEYIVQEHCPRYNFEINKKIERLTERIENLEKLKGDNNSVYFKSTKSGRKDK